MALEILATQAVSGTGETVMRPEPGIARGRWEAPAWAFYAVLLAALVASTVWAVAALRRRRAAR